MSEPIRTKPKSSMKIDNAPTPHNTPSSVIGSFLKNGNPVNSNVEIPKTVSEEDIQSLMANQPFLLQSIQDKLGSLVGQDSGYVDKLPKDVKDRIYGLKTLQNGLFSLEKDFQIEMFELEKKYLAKYAPLNDRRYKLITGQVEPTKEEIEMGKDEEEEDEEEEEEEEEEQGAEVVGIPSFWLTALENLPVVSDTITDRDAEVLDFLTDIKLEYLNNGKPGFKLTFKFDSTNPFFKNEELVKTYYYQNELGYSGDFIYDHAEGDVINWSDNESNATISVEMRKQRNKSTKQVRVIEKIVAVESFFNFFDPPKVNEVDEEEEDDEENDLEERLALDYAIGEKLKDTLIPRAVDWFTGAALEFEFDGEEEEYDGEEEDDDDEDDDDDDDDDDDEEEEDEEDEFAGKKEQPPECKQQ